MLTLMKSSGKSNVGKILFRIGRFTGRVSIALLAILRDVFAAVEVERNDDRQLHDSDLSGELNHRTGRLDSGTDPYGWYDRD